MKKKKLYKDIRQSISHSWGRFISIMFLMLLGSLALVGLAVTGPDMRQTGINYFNELNTADITILSDYGIDKSEQEYIEKASNVKELDYFYLKDVTISDTNDSIRIFSKPDKISLYEITEGSLPKENNEIAISDSYSDRYNIGDTITFYEKLSEDEEGTLKNHEFKIVGFINSSEILSNLNLGQSTAGTGELKGYAIINKDNFNSDVYMMAKLTFTDTQGLDPYSDEYNDKIVEHKEELSNLLKEQQDIRLSSIKSEYQKEIDDGRKELDDAKKELEDTRTQLSDAKKQIEDAKQEIADNEKKLNDAKNQINNAQTEITKNEQTLKNKETEYNNSLAEYNQKKQELENAGTQISNSQTEIDNNTKLLEDAKSKYETGLNELKEAIYQCEELLKNPNLSEEEKNTITYQLAQYQAMQKQTESEYNVFLNDTYNPSITGLNEAQKILDEKKQEYNSRKTGIRKCKYNAK